MRVVHIGHVPLPAEHPDYGRLYSHPGRWVLNLAMAQAAHTAIEPSIVTQVPGASVDWRCEVDGIKVEFVRVPDRLRAATLFQFDKRTLSRKALATNPDIVHAHGTEEAYAMAAQATGKPNVITLQGVFAIINKELPPKLVSRARIIEFLEARVLRRAKHIIAKSDYIAERTAALFPNLQIHRIPNTFDPRLLAIDTTKKPRSACFVGMVTERKGLDLVVEALQQLDKTAYPSEFHVVGNRGNGEAPYDRRVLAELRQLLGDRLVLHGIVPALEAARIIARCEVLLAPSREEMFGNQLIEALLLRTFPVVSEGTALAENSRKFVSGKIVPSPSHPDWPTALKSPLHGRGEEMTRVRDEVLSQMGPVVVAEAHYKLYQQIIQSGDR